MQQNSVGVIGRPGMPAPPTIQPVRFIANRSFTFAIMNEDRIIFVGQYLQPESS